MADSLHDELTENAKWIAGAKKALKRYPDLHYREVQGKGRVLVSESARADCDDVQIAAPTSPSASGVRFLPCLTFEGVTVFGGSSRYEYEVLAELKKKPAAWAALVDAVRGKR